MYLIFITIFVTYLVLAIFGIAERRATKREEKEVEDHVRKSNEVRRYVDEVLDYDIRMSLSSSFDFMKKYDVIYAAIMVEFPNSYGLLSDDQHIKSIIISLEGREQSLRWELLTDEEKKKLVQVLSDRYDQLDLLTNEEKLQLACNEFTAHIDRIRKY